MNSQLSTIQLLSRASTWLLSNLILSAAAAAQRRGPKSTSFMYIGTCITQLGKIFIRNRPIVDGPRLVRLCGLMLSPLPSGLWCVELKLNPVLASMDTSRYQPEVARSTTYVWPRSLIQNSIVGNRLLLVQLINLIVVWIHIIVRSF